MLEEIKSCTSEHGKWNYLGSAIVNEYRECKSFLVIKVFMQYYHLIIRVLNKAFARLLP